jgi:hypothetical protein
MLCSKQLGNLQLPTSDREKVWGNGHPTWNSNSGTQASNLKITDIKIWPLILPSSQLSWKHHKTHGRLPFASSFLCEAGFSALICIKTKYPSRLDVIAEMRCAESTTPPDFEKPCPLTLRSSDPTCIKSHPSHWWWWDERHYVRLIWNWLPHIKSMWWLRSCSRRSRVEKTIRNTVRMFYNCTKGKKWSIISDHFDLQFVTESDFVKLFAHVYVFIFVCLLNIVGSGGGR